MSIYMCVYIYIYIYVCKCTNMKKQNKKQNIQRMILFIVE